VVLLAELGALFDNEVLPLLQQFKVHVCEEKRYLVVFSIAGVYFVRIELAVKLMGAGKMLRHDDRADQLRGLTHHRLARHLAPLLALLQEEAQQELVEELEHLILGAFLGSFEHRSM